jgi:hypothetical protein
MVYRALGVAVDFHCGGRCGIHRRRLDDAVENAVTARRAASL